ncbi:type II toxin-antitoxin system ParD family antitoxin [Aliivibrio fischeri]|uniref:type II toxin-antitoxin system ParD family antitoxin n=1 Tax=Aliivibrio fischeri TaxID=668 RepID=UPI0012D86345|nr:type II toxin-antitoxin system ParD family antitoxin [Aliivibrio fischeri]MUJ27930.1 type II toxin-antitoxin system ParD family antitoxin [Aliivibrio fischeri]MUK76607.1 type II toxin-antitoxin system ParD family antitoxin [Aliivibrio fischeri]
MSRTTSVTIGESLDGFVGRMINSGRYGSASEVMRSALRLLEQEENQLDLLRRAIEEGETSGVSTLSLKEIATRKKAMLRV